ncbi:hypothetical protein V8V91_08975 [Algoriphagus halophilus]|uniref:hypothetical protein n=1 Tax=Algoriphagus halophilus TaxID=226505 RepID=UPI00358FF747
METLQEKIQKVDREFDEDFIQILMNVRSTDSISFERMESSGNIHPYFLLNSNRDLIYWSDFTFSFDFEQIDQDKEYQLIEDPFGSILIKVRQISRNGDPVLMVQALRLIYPGNIENDYLVTGANPEIFGNNRFTLFTNAEEGRYQVKNPGGIPIFGIDFLFGYQPADRLANPAILIFLLQYFYSISF